MRPGRRGVRQSLPPLHPGADRLGAEDDRQDGAPLHDRGAAAVTDGSAGRLPVRTTLPACRAALRGRLPAVLRCRRGAQRGLLAVAGPMIGVRQGEPLLRVERLRKYYPFTKGVLFAKTLGNVKAVDDVSFTIGAGETLGLVGESGCGKTTTSKLILNLEAPSEGQVLLDGEPIHGLSGEALRQYRARVQAVFQDPWSSLNPRMRVGRTIAESLIVTGWGHEKIAARVSELLVEVGLRPEQATQYPHEFSGGQRQRIALAGALASRPRLIVLD